MKAHKEGTDMNKNSAPNTDRLAGLEAGAKLNPVLDRLVRQVREQAPSQPATVNGYTDRNEHIAALIAQGMTPLAAKAAEMRAFMGTARSRRTAYLEAHPAEKAEHDALRAEWAAKYGIVTR